jgi:hypothetical protein
MWVFKSSIRDSYLATNPKVLTQTLLQQANLTRFTSKRRYLHMLAKEVSPEFGPEYVMLVRNPYKRLESFFKEKLRQKVKMVFDDNPYVLKRHQEIFYSYLKIKPSDPLEVKASALLKLSFKEFIMNIKNVYQLEDHIAPQTLNFSRKFMGVTRVMQMNKYVHLENGVEMKWLADYFKLDLSIRINTTREVDDTIEWDKESIAVVKDIFRKDFETFGYSAEP